MINVYDILINWKSGNILLMERKDNWGVDFKVLADIVACCGMAGLRQELIVMIS